MSLDALRDVASGCTQCWLSGERTNVVFDRGNPDAPFMVIGEAPGEDEDRQGEPFVGKSGRKLNEMLTWSGVDPSQVYYANVLKCRPPRNRFPEDGCPATCLPYLLKQIKLTKPKAVLLAGKQALRYVLLHGTGQPHEPLTPWVGKQYRRRDLFKGTRFGVIYHPAYLLRNDNDDDEETCISTISSLWIYAQAKIAGDAPPLVQFEDIKPPPPVMHQRRSLFRTGERYPPE